MYSKRKHDPIRTIIVLAVWVSIPMGIFLQLPDVVIILGWLSLFLAVMVRDEMEARRGRQIIRQHQADRREFIRNSFLKYF